MSGRCLFVALCVLGWSVGAGAQEPGTGRLRIAAGLFPVNQDTSLRFIESDCVMLNSSLVKGGDNRLMWTM